jgi:hypothetical protein
MSEELELTQAQIERNNIIDNAVQDCICILAEEEIEWDMDIIGDVTEAIKEVLAQHGLRVRQPAIATDELGNQRYVEYEEE